MEWIRTNYDSTLIQCPDDELCDAWYQKVVSLVESMETIPEFQIHDNGYRNFPRVFVVEGIKGAFKGHNFGIWSDRPGEILLEHSKIPRSAVEPLCTKVRECWLAIGGASHPHNLASGLAKLRGTG